MFDHLIDTNLWIALHRHKYGYSTYQFTANTEPTEDQIVKACGIDYEPYIGEALEWFQISLDKRYTPHIET